MADRKVGSTAIGSAGLLTIVVTMVAVSRMPLLGFEWFYTGCTGLLTIAWDVSPALCLLTIAFVGGTVGHRAAMKKVADQLTREKWNREGRSAPLEREQEIYLKPVRILIPSSTPSPSSAECSQDG